MSNNDPKRNRNNLLFKPNNTIDDGQPKIFIYPKTDTPPGISNISGSITETNITENNFGQNNSSYHLPPPISQNFNLEINVNQPNIWNLETNQNTIPLIDTSQANIPPSTPYFSASQIGSKPPTTTTTTAPPWIPLFSASDIISKPATTEPPSSGIVNNYRRVGSKRPVYAPIPGLSNFNQQQQTTQFDSQKSINIASTVGTYERTNILTSHFAPNPIQKGVPKSLFVPSDSSQVNSPFLNPVSELIELPNTEISNSSHIPGSFMPVMASNDVQLSTTSSLTFSNDDGLPTMSEVVNTMYRPAYHHWFYKKETEIREMWEPFSMFDSLNLESNFTSPDLTPDKNIQTDGGRYDVNILRRQRTSVYWTSKPSEVRRCSWFQKNHNDSRYVPFEENVATQLEEEYKSAVELNQWHKKIILPSGEIIMFHSANVLVLFSPSQFASSMDNSSQENQPKPKTVKRGMDEFNIDEGESEIIDHLLFMVHGIGSGCDLKFRSVEEVVDDFRNIALQLIRTHYRSSSDRKLVNRVEILPISWHEKLHSEDTGIDNKLKSITLESIPKLREFTNDTLLDILFYTSPIYGQTIITSVGNELNRIYDLFKQRNPKFEGGVSLAGHSLGSLILFDILCNQLPIPEEHEELLDENEMPITLNKPHPLNRKMSRRISYMMGSVGTGQVQIHYPHLNFQPITFFALGSPIGMFVTIRGLDNLGEKFALPTCPGFFNIFHPYDPVAYRIESLINPLLATVKPVLIPHHKGRKRMHLELKETMAKVGSDLKQKLVDSMKNTWNSLMSWSNTKPPIQPSIAEEVDKVLEEFANTHADRKEGDDQIITEATGLNLGLLNKGRRVDYVLQEAPVEFFNEYIFALTSHVCYWESEDTVLLILKEIYNMLNVSPDCQIPQQTMTIERPPSASRSPDIASTSRVKIGVDPTVPMKRDINIGPPPLSGFIKEN